MNTENKKDWSILAIVAVTWAASTFLDHVVFFFATGPFNFSIIDYLSPIVWVALTVIAIISAMQVKKKDKRGMSLSIIAIVIGALFIAQLIYFLFVIPVPKLF